MIYSSFEGRIGNNLFQLAACLALADKYKTEACVGLSGNMRYIKENFILKNITFVDNGDPDGFNYYYRLPETITNTYSEQFFQFDKNFFNTPDNSFIRGFFQSEKYFKHVENLIRENFTFQQHILDAVKKICYFEPNKKNIGFIHIRRQDYMHETYKKYYPQPTLEYYMNCINENKLKEIYIFSDDIEWCVDIFKNFNDKKFIPVMETNPYISLCMMSQINTAIIANSTFSWWGSWLNNKINKKTYYPIPWYGNITYEKYNITEEEYIKDLVCENWVGIKCQ